MRSSATMSRVCPDNGYRYIGDHCGIAERRECARITQAIDRASPRLLSAANLLEASIVIDSRKGETAGRELDLLIYRANIEIVAVDQDQAEIARIAWRRFGKGRHPAALNYGDCFAYALTKSQRLPLLYLGHDFSQTDARKRAVSRRLRRWEKNRYPSAFRGAGITCEPGSRNTVSILAVALAARSSDECASYSAPTSPTVFITPSRACRSSSLSPPAHGGG
jgi:ribonuclease VapC